MKAAAGRGPFGYPVAGLNIRIISVTRDKDTTGGALRACAAGLIDDLLRHGDHVYLEPIMALVVDVPTSYVGDVLSDLSMQRRARIGDVDAHEGIGRTLIKAQVPFATMLGYATIIRSMTQGTEFWCSMSAFLQLM